MGMDDQSLRIAGVVIFWGVVRMVNWIWVCEKMGYYFSLTCQKTKKAGRQLFKLSS